MQEYGSFVETRLIASLIAAKYQNTLSSLSTFYEARAAPLAMWRGAGGEGTKKNRPFEAVFLFCYKQIIYVSERNRCGVP